MDPNEESFFSKIVNSELGKNTFFNISLVSFIFFVVAIFGFGYIFVEINGVKQPSDPNRHRKKKDNSISCQLANGFAPGIITLLVIGGFLLLFLIIKSEIINKKEISIPIIKACCVLLLVVLVITIIWVSPYKVSYPKENEPTDDPDFKKMQEKHNIIAMICFTITQIYIILTYFNLRKEGNPTNALKISAYIFLALSLLAYLTLVGIGIAFGAGKAGSYDLVLFPIAEIVFFISFLVFIIIYGLWGKTIIEQKDEQKKIDLNNKIKIHFQETKV